MSIQFVQWADDTTIWPAPPLTMLNTGTPSIAADIDVPAGTVAGNLLVLCVFLVATTNDISGIIINNPAGWTARGGLNGASSIISVQSWTKTATGSEPASYHLTSAQPGYWMAAMVQYPGAHDHSAGNLGQNDTKWTTTAYTNTNPDDRTVVFAGVAALAGATPAIPAGVTLRGQTGPSSVYGYVQVCDYRVAGTAVAPLASPSWGLTMPYQGTISMSLF